MQHDDPLLKKELNGQATKPAADARWRPTRGGFTVYRRLLQRWGRLASLVTLCVLVLWVVGEHMGGRRVGVREKHGGSGSGKGMKKLGFDEVFVVQEQGSMEALKGFEAAANASGLEYIVLEALDEEDDAKREMKRSVGTSELEIMSHINAWERIRSQNLPSTLLLSASADWDLRLPTSMSFLPQAISTLLRLSPPSRGPRHHPRHFPFFSSSNRYGSGWDILFLGHCGASPLQERDYYMFNDTSAPSPSHVFAFPWAPNERYPRQEGERMVFTPEHLACAGTGYALSYNAAVHLLEIQKREVVKTGVEPQDCPLNHLLLNGCRDQNIGLNCLAPFPQLFSPALAHSRPGPGIEISARRNGFLGITPANKGGDDDATTAWVKESGDYGAMPGTREEEVELPDPRAEKAKPPMKKKKEVGSSLHGEDDRDGQRGEHGWSSGNCSPGSRGCWDWPRTQEGQKRKFQGEEELRVIRESELGYGGLG